MNLATGIVLFSISLGVFSGGLVTNSASAAENSASAPAGTIPDLSQALASCQNLKEKDVRLAFTKYQGHTVSTSFRDQKLGLFCQGPSALNLFWALARRKHKATSPKDLERRVELWDNRQLKVALHLSGVGELDGTQVGCYGTWSGRNPISRERTREKSPSKNSEEKPEILQPYCWTIFAISDGVLEKILQDRNIGESPLYKAIEECLRSASPQVSRNDHYLTCEGSEAVRLLTVFRDETSRWGSPYALTKEELRKFPAASGTGSAIYSRGNNSERVVFGETRLWSSDQMTLSDLTKCQKDLTNVEQKSFCRFFVGSDGWPR
jgi:hypothetical protein